MLKRLCPEAGVVLCSFPKTPARCWRKRSGPDWAGGSTWPGARTCVSSAVLSLLLCLNAGTALLPEGPVPGFNEPCSCEPVGCWDCRIFHFHNCDVQVTGSTPFAKSSGFKGKCTGWSLWSCLSLSHRSGAQGLIS